MITPRLNGRLRELAQRIADDPSQLIGRLHETLMAGEPGYAALSPMVKHDVREFLTFSATLWFRTLIEGHEPTDAEVRVVSDTIRRRVHQGISLSAVLHAARLGSKELWITLVELAGDDAADREDLLHVFSTYLLDYFDDLAQTIASTYVDEQFQRARWRDALRHELLNVVFSFPDDNDAFERATAALGLDPAVPRVCLAVEVALPEALPAHVEGELDRLLVAVSRSLGMAAENLVRAFYRDRLLVWVPVVRGDSVLASDQLMHRHAVGLAESVPGFRRIGVGLANAGARGWATSMDEAFRALEGGLRMGTQETVLGFSDIVLNESVLRSDNALRYLDAVIERLSHEQDLLATLWAFLDGGQRRKHAAEQLGIHPNTLNYRLSRIEEILGASLADTGWLARLHVALTLRHASDPARRPAPPPAPGRL